MPNIQSLLFLPIWRFRMRESKFQSELKKEIAERFPGCIITKNDANYIQGIPDLLVLYEDKWAMLECKKNASAKHRPNQDYYVDKLNKMSYSAFIFPENKEEVLNAMERSFKGHSGRSSCSVRSE